MYNSKHLRTGSEEPKLNPDKLTIFNMRFCPYAERVVLVAIAKGIEFDVVNINLMHKPEWYFVKNPLGKVPAVQQGDFLEVESLTINDVLEKRYPNVKLWPTEEGSQKRQKEFLETFDEKIARPYNRLYRTYTVPGSGDADQLYEELIKGLDLMEDYLKRENTPFLGGHDRPGLLDYNAWPWMPRMIIFSDKYLAGKRILDSSRFERITKWVELMKKDVAVEKYSIPDDTMTVYMKRAKEGDPDRYDMLMGV